MTQLPFLDIALLLVLFFGAWSFWMFRVKEIDFVDEPIFSISYYAFWSALLILFFPIRIREAIEGFVLKPFVVLVAVLLFGLFSYWWLRKHFGRPEDLIEKYSHEYFLRLRYDYFVSKSFSIFFQQVMIVLMSMMLSEGGFSPVEVGLIFAVIFGALHSPLLGTEGVMGDYFVVSGTVAGFVFPLFILNFHYGFVYSFSIHWLFYIVSSIFFVTFPEVGRKWVKEKY